MEVQKLLQVQDVAPPVDVALPVRSNMPFVPSEKVAVDA